MDRADEVTPALLCPRRGEEDRVLALARRSRRADGIVFRHVRRRLRPTFLLLLLAVAIVSLFIQYLIIRTAVKTGTPLAHDQMREEEEERLAERRRESSKPRPTDE